MTTDIRFFFQQIQGLPHPENGAGWQITFLLTFGLLYLSSVSAFALAAANATMGVMILSLMIISQVYTGGLKDLLRNDYQSLR